MPFLSRVVVVAVAGYNAVVDVAEHVVEDIQIAWMADLLAVVV